MSALELLSILRRRVYYASTQSAETFRLRPQIALDARKFRRSFAVLQLSKCQIGRRIGKLDNEHHRSRGQFRPTLLSVPHVKLLADAFALI